MRPVSVEYLLDGDKAVFYFEAEERVDFRELVRKLAAHFTWRIDMRQIGVRDEARMVGGPGPLRPGAVLQAFGRRVLPGVHPHGQGAGPFAQPAEDLGRVRTAHVLPSLRVRRLQGLQKPRAQAELPGADAGGPGQGGGFGRAARGGVAQGGGREAGEGAAFGLRSARGGGKPAEVRGRGRVGRRLRPGDDGIGGRRVGVRLPPPAHRLRQAGPTPRLCGAPDERPPAPRARAAGAGKRGGKGAGKAEGGSSSGRKPRRRRSTKVGGEEAAKASGAARGRQSGASQKERAQGQSAQGGPKGRKPAPRTSPSARAKRKQAPQGAKQGPRPGQKSSALRQRRQADAPRAGKEDAQGAARTQAGGEGGHRRARRRSHKAGGEGAQGASSQRRGEIGGAAPRMKMDYELLTDLYQLTMAQGYWETGRAGTQACFHMYFRDYRSRAATPSPAAWRSWRIWWTPSPSPTRTWRIWPRSTRRAAAGLFKPAFLEHLRGFRLGVDIDAVPEGANTRSSVSFG